MAQAREPGSDDTEPYSRLEVAKPPHEQSEDSEPYSRLQVAESSKVESENSAPKFIFHIAEENRENKEAVAASIIPDDNPLRHRHFRRRRRMLLWACVVFVVIAAIISGVVGGVLSRRSRHSSEHTNNLPPSSTVPTMTGPAEIHSGFSYPTAVSGGYPHLEVFAISPKNLSAYWKHRSDARSSWTTKNDSPLDLVGGNISTFQLGVAAVARSVGVVDIFTIGTLGTGNTSFQKSHNNSFNWDPPAPDDWYGRDGIFVAGIEVISWSADRMDLFGFGTGAQSLFQSTWMASTNGWSSWATLGGSWAALTPTVVSWAASRLDVFVVNNVSRAVYHKFWDGSLWQPAPDSFNNIGGYATSRPIAVSRTTGQWDVFARGGDAGLWQISYTQKTDRLSNWFSISGNTSIQGEPEAVSWGDDRIDVFAWGADRNASMLHKSFDAKTNVWTPSNGFEVLGIGLTGPPKAVADAPGSVHVFAYGKDMELLHKQWNETLKSWTPEDDVEVLGTFPASE